MKSPSRETVQEVWTLRWPERHLLIWCLLCIALGFLLALGSSHDGGRPLTPADCWPLLGFAISLLAVHLTLVLCRFRGDQLLLVTAAFLAGFGLLVQYRMAPPAGADPLTQQLFPAGMAVMLAVTITLMRDRYHALAGGFWFWGGLSLVLVAALLVTGQRFRGGVYAAGFITPTEILKVTVILFLAGFIDQRRQALSQWGGGLVPPLPALAPLAVCWGLLTALLLLQRDLGMVVMLSAALLLMLLIGTGRLGYLVYGAAATGGAGYLMLRYFEHTQRRVQAWLDPFQDPTGASWQILQGLSGMHSGGLWGESFGQGNPEYTPIAESDFIYSVIGEELGFAGCMAVAIFFLIFFSRGFRIAYQTSSSYGMLLGAGLTTVLAAQTLLNIGGVTKFIPLTGTTLPFISHGGSSLLTGFVMLGLLLAISEGEAPAGRRQRSSA